MEEITWKSEAEELKGMIREHVEVTGSVKGRMILEHFEEYLPKFKKIIPNDYKKMLVLSKHYEEMGLGSEQAQIEAFYESTGQKKMGGNQ